MSTLKRAPDGFDIDQPGKVSHRRREAGCREVMLVGDRRLALMMEFREEPQPSLAWLAARLLPVDIVVAEGFKGAAVPTVEVFVAARQQEPRCRSDPNIVAVVTDDPVACAVPCFRSATWTGCAAFSSSALRWRHGERPQDDAGRPGLPGRRSGGGPSAKQER